MKRNLTKRWGLLVPLAMLLATAVAARADEPATTPASPADETVAVIVQDKEPGDKPQGEAGEILQNVVVVQDKGPHGEKSATLTLDVEMVQPGAYWLGIICLPIEDELLKAHLGIEHGMIVKEVVNDSPAAKAGLQPQDILIQVGDQPLTGLKALVEKVEETQENPLTLTLIRKGQRQNVDVTPVKRPETPIMSTTPDKEADDEWKLLQDSLRGHWMPQIVEQDGTDGMRMLFVMPGFVLPDQAKDFPKNLEVTIVKKGEEPAKITVKRDDEQWEVDANSLDKLPEDIRPHVKQMLGGGLSVAVGDGSFSWSSNLPRPLVMPKVTPDRLKKTFKVAPNLRMELRSPADKVPAEVREKVDAQLKEVQEQLDEVRSSIPTETLDKIQQELKELREQIEKLRAERAEKAQQKVDAEKAAEQKEEKTDEKTESDTPPDGQGTT